MPFVDQGDGEAPRNSHGDVFIYLEATERGGSFGGVESTLTSQVKAERLPDATERNTRVICRQLPARCWKHKSYLQAASS